VQRKFRLTRSEDFKRVRRNGKSYAHPLAVLVAQPGEGPQTRVGVAAGKASGSAVHTESSETYFAGSDAPAVAALAPHWDLILIARPLSRSQPRANPPGLQTLLQRANLIPADETQRPPA
jgi:RNase P protein component